MTYHLFSPSPFFPLSFFANPLCLCFLHFFAALRLIVTIFRFAVRGLDLIRILVHRLDEQTRDVRAELITEKEVRVPVCCFFI
jgi:hypothetical protein